MYIAIHNNLVYLYYTHVHSIITSSINLILVFAPCCLDTQIFNLVSKRILKLGNLTPKIRVHILLVTQDSAFYQMYAELAHFSMHGCG